MHSNHDYLPVVGQLMQALSTHGAANCTTIVELKLKNSIEEDLQHCIRPTLHFVEVGNKFGKGPLRRSPAITKYLSIFKQIYMMAYFTLHQMRNYKFQSQAAKTNHFALPRRS